MRARILRMGRWAACLAASSLAAISTGCADSPAPAAATVVDSAGVRIVTNAPGADAAAERWTLSPEPVIEIGGGADPDLPLYQVTTVRPLADGRVAVGTNSPPRALVFDADGTLAATLGRPGEGPGEFFNVGSVVPLDADSLLVWDRDRRRMSVFTDDGGYVRDVDLSGLLPLSPIAAPSTEAPAGFTYLLPLASGSIAAFVVGVWGSETAEAGVVRMEVPSHRVGADGSPQATYGSFPGMQLYWSPATGIVPYPFGAATHGATSGDALVVGTADVPEVRFYAPDGALEQIVRWHGRGRTLAGSPLLADYDTWLDAQLAEREPREAAFLREILDAIPRPELLPAYAGIVGDVDTGQVWIGDYPGQLGLMMFAPDVPPVPARGWLVFDADGTLAATVRTPQRFEPHAVRDGRVWGVFKGELGVESVRAYAIVRP